MTPENQIIADDYACHISRLQSQRFSIQATIRQLQAVDGDLERQQERMREEVALLGYTALNVPEQRNSLEQQQMEAGQ